MAAIRNSKPKHVGGHIVIIGYPDDTRQNPIFYFAHILYNTEEELRQYLVHAYSSVLSEAMVSRLHTAIAIAHDNHGVIGEMYNLNSTIEVNGTTMVVQLPEEVKNIWTPIVQKYCDVDYSPIFDPDF